jgi:hypothetical protein
LDGDIVPLTVLRDVENMECSVQVFVPHDPREHYFTMAKNHSDVMEMFCVFDYLTNNADRKAGHILLEQTESFSFKPAPPIVEDGDEEVVHITPTKLKNNSNGNDRFYGIDHGLTFNVDDKLANCHMGIF